MSTLKSITAEVLLVLGCPEAFVTTETCVTASQLVMESKDAQLEKLRLVFGVTVEASDTIGELVKRIYDSRLSLGE